MTLKLEITREVQPKEIGGLVWGSGALTWDWWQRVTLRRPTIGPLPGGGTGITGWTVIEDTEDIEEGDYVFFVVDDPDEPEGSGKVLKLRVSLPTIVNAASRAIKGDGAHIDDESSRDMRMEDLGYADAIAGDAVLQLAVFGKVVYG